MPFVTKNPAHYLEALAEDSAEPLHIGLFFSRSINEQQTTDLIKLAKAIQQSTRTIRCLWLRFRDGDESICAALQSFGDELVDAASIQSLVIEGKAGPAEVACLAGFIRRNQLRGLQFRRTDIDASASAVLRPLFLGSDTLNVLDMSQNSKLGDLFIKDMLTSLSEGETNIESLSIGECDIDTAGDNDEMERISGSRVELIAGYVLRCKCGMLYNVLICVVRCILTSPLSSISIHADKFRSQISIKLNSSSPQFGRYRYRRASECVEARRLHRETT